MITQLPLSEEQVARLIATIAHYGDTVSDGPKINHAAAVAAKVSPQNRPCAWLHDVLEDSEWITEEHLLAAGITAATVDAVVLLTRVSPYNYDKYITSILESKNHMAWSVKQADLEHNLRPSCPEQLRPRYEKALARFLQAWRAL